MDRVLAIISAKNSTNEFYDELVLDLQYKLNDKIEIYQPVQRRQRDINALESITEVIIALSWGVTSVKIFSYMFCNRYFHTLKPFSSVT